MENIESAMESLTSLPAWGVWIEIKMQDMKTREEGGRSPHGECGLKSYMRDIFSVIQGSLPAWGVWIEIEITGHTRYVRAGRSPHGECGLKFLGMYGKIPC